MKKKADYLVLLANATLKESTDLAESFPSSTWWSPRADPRNRRPADDMLNGGKTVLVQVGEKGMNAVVLGLFADPQASGPLSARAAGFAVRRLAAMKQLMAAYQEQLKQMGFARARAPPRCRIRRRRPTAASSARRSASECHEESNKVWKQSAHAEAYATLANLDPPRNYRPGVRQLPRRRLASQQVLPLSGRLRSHEKTPHLENVGCEDCHGPGQGTRGRRERATTRHYRRRCNRPCGITKEEAADPLSGKQNCFSCHDGDNSPDFDFETYWPLIEHHED